MNLQSLLPRSPASPPWALWRVLDELESLLGDVMTDVYCARLAADVSGSIGGHVRHCLDHVSTLLTADPATTLSYDRRQRGTAVETDPAEPSNKSCNSSTPWAPGRRDRLTSRFASRR
ncbi:MAG: hypothetical protein ABJA98_34245 [Acidobacteriota bacterium]